MAATKGLSLAQIKEAVALEGGSVVRGAERLGLAHSTVSRRLRGVAANAPRPVDDREILDPERIREDQEHAERAHLRRENKQIREALADREGAIQRIVESARLPVPVPRYRTTRTDPTLPVRSIVLPIFDIQYGQHVRAADVPFGKGGYSASTFDERLALYVDKVKRFLLDRAGSTRFDELHIVLGGDLTEGDQIFPGQAWQLERHPIQQVLELRVKLASAIREIVRFAKEQLGTEVVAIYCVPGNHGKVGGKRAGATPADYSWDYVACEFIRDQLRTEPVDLFVNEAAGALLFETHGIRFLSIHGDEVKGHSGIPHYGLAKFDARVIRLAEVIPHYTLLGHHHQPAAITNGSGGEWIISGDWVGGNNLSKWIVAASRPQQRVLLVGRKYGVTEDARIYFDTMAERGPATIHNVREAA